MAKTVLFGGSFDPIHLGHLIISRFVAEKLRAERIILLPGAVPPHKQDRVLAPPADRLAMCRLAVAGDPLFEVSDWELGQTGPNYTLITVCHYRETLPRETHVCWLIGMDSLVELGTWYHVGELVESCEIVTAARPGFENPDLSPLRGPLRDEQIERLRRNILESPWIDISATEIRERVRSGLSVRYLVCEDVRRYIQDRRLYR